MRRMRRELRRVETGDPLPGRLGKLYKFEVVTWGKRKIGVFAVPDFCPTFERVWGKLRGRR